MGSHRGQGTKWSKGPVGCLLLLLCGRSVAGPGGRFDPKSTPLGQIEPVPLDRSHTWMGLETRLAIIRIIPVKCFEIYK